MFLDIAGIPGESTDPAHTNQVDVLAWSWGMSSSGSAQTGGGGTGIASFQSVNVTKYVDKASPPLMLACAKGIHIPMATLYVRNTDTNPIEYFKIQLTNVLVTTVSTGGSGGEDQLTENVSLNFANVQLDYIPVKPDVDAGTPFSFRWDIPSNSGTRDQSGSWPDLDAHLHQRRPGGQADLDKHRGCELSGLVHR